ncbi:hypothetical protein A2U01_0118762, partial [Trifolium medium]|nr:hypothetical protein [Trifolium medium]
RPRHSKPGSEEESHCCAEEVSSYDFLGCYHVARCLTMHHASSSTRVLG